MKRKTAYILLLIPLFFAYSYFLISNYTYGDHRSYRPLYKALAYADFSEVFEVSQHYITANDGFSFYILWLGAIAGIDKDIFIALANTILLLGLYITANKYNINKTMFFLMLTNFYIIVLMTGAERLKFAFILLILAEITEKKWLKVIFSSLSIFAHLQSLILIGSTILGSFSQKIIDALRGNKLPVRIVFSFFAVVLLGLFFVYYKQDDIWLKFRSYASDVIQFSEIFQIAALLIAAVYFAKNKIALLFSFIPLGVSVLILGGQRVNMIAVIVAILFFWKEGKPNHPFMYALMLYFSIKSIPFVSNIINYGDGFYGI